MQPCDATAGADRDGGRADRGRAEGQSSAARGRLCGARADGIGRRAGPAGPGRGRPAGLDRHVPVARGRVDRRRFRRHGGALRARGGGAGALVRRQPRLRRRFPHLCVRAGLRDHAQRPIAAADFDPRRHRDRADRCALFRRPRDEAVRQLLPWVSGAVESGRVLPVRGASRWLDRVRRRADSRRAHVRPVSVRPSAAGQTSARTEYHHARGVVGAGGCGPWTQSRRGTLDCGCVVCHRRLLSHRRPAGAAYPGLTHSRMLELLTDPQAWAALVTLTVLEIVLGIDNVVFISILVSRLDPERSKRARQIGLALAFIFRIIMLGGLTWLMSLRQPVVTAFGMDLSWRDLILIGGGLFLIAKATHEIHGEVEARESGTATAASPRTALMIVIAQLIVVDLVFSLDSIITAIGMAQDIEVMIAAIIIAMLVMYVASGPVAAFIAEYPTTKMLALAFLVLIGMALVADGFDFHIPRGYIYFAMAFAGAVEFFNVLARRNRRRAKSS